jgi:hypothetical protein
MAGVQTMYIVSWFTQISWFLSLAIVK